MQQSETTFDLNQPAMLNSQQPVPLKYLETKGAVTGQSPTFNGNTVVWDNGTGNPSAPLTGIQYNIDGDFFADSLATRDPSDNYYTNLAAPVRAIKFFDQKGNRVSLRAINYGNSGNSIILTFDGIIDVGTAAANWNAANPSNQVEVIAGSNYVVVLPITSVQLIQGGEASVKIGHTDAFSQLGNTNVSGGSAGIFDGTNLSFIGTAYGDVTQFTGIDGNVLLSGFIDFPNNETSFSLATKDQYTIQFSDSNGISTLNLTGKGFNLSYGTDFGYESDGEFIGFFTPNYNLKFPTTTPNLGDTIQVVSTAGVNYYTNWVPAGGSVTLNQNRIAFGNASNQITWDDGLQYDVTTGKFMTGTGDTYFMVDPVNGNIVSNVSVEGQYLITGTRNGTNYAMFRGEHGTGTVMIGNEVGDTNNTNITIHNVDAMPNTITMNGLRNNHQSAIDFTGTGTNNMDIVTLYNDFNTTATFHVEITRKDAQQLGITSLAGGTPALNDTVTGSTTGATGVVFATDGVSYIILKSVVGTFSGTEALTSDSTWTATTILATLVSDMFVMTSGTQSTPEQFCASPINGLYGVMVAFGSPTGHNVNDRWLWGYGVTFGLFSKYDGLNRILEIGDPQDILGGLMPTFTFNGTNGNIDLKSYNFNVSNPVGNLSFYANSVLFSNGLGDLNNQVGGAKMQINNRNGIKDYYGGISNSSIVIVPDDDNYNIAVIDYMIEMHPKFTDTFITLPTLPQFGDTYMVKNKEFGTFNVIVGGGGPNIDGSATDTISGSLTIQQSKTYTYNGTEWSIY